MKTKVWFINILLVILVVWLGNRAYVDWKLFQQNHDPSRVRDVRPAAAAGKTPSSTTPAGAPADPAAAAMAAAGAVPVQVQYQVISDRNVFAPERRPAPLEGASAPVVPQAPPLDPKPTLAGITIIGTNRTAFIQEGGAQAGGAARVVGLGDNVRGYTVAEINPDAVVLQWNDVRHTLDLVNSDQPKVRGAVAMTAPAPVLQINVGKKAATAGQQAAAAVAVAPPQAQPGAQIQVTAAGGAAGIGPPGAQGQQGQQGLRAGAQGGQGNLGRQQSPGNTPFGNMSGPQRGRTPSPAGSGNTINTPFGQIQRRPY